MSDLVIAENQLRSLRRPASCDGCGRAIGQGELYNYGRGLDSYVGHWYDWASCLECTACLAAYRDSIDPDYEGWSADSFENWIEYRYDNPELTAAEVRHMAGWRHDWRTASGDLWRCSAALTKQMAVLRDRHIVEKIKRREAARQSRAEAAAS